LDPDTTAVDLRKPAGDGEAETRPSLTVRTAAAVECLEDLRLLLCGDARPVIDHAYDELRSYLVCADLDDIRRRGELQRILEDVDQDVLELRGIHADRRRVVRDHDVDALAVPSEDFERARDEPVDGPELWYRARGACLETGEVEQVRHEAIEPADLKANRIEQLVALGAGQGCARAPEHLTRVHDRGDR